MATVQFVLDHPDAKLPRYAHGPQEDAGMDLASVEEVWLRPGEWAQVDTGLRMEMPAGLEGQIRPRSGLANAQGITVLNAPGTVDPGYRGPLKVLLINLGRQTKRIGPGDRIAQIVFAHYEPIQAQIATTLNDSQRSAGGFGSTGR